MKEEILKYNMDITCADYLTGRQVTPVDPEAVCQIDGFISNVTIMHNASKLHFYTDTFQDTEGRLEVCSVTECLRPTVVVSVLVISK